MNELKRQIEKYSIEQLRELYHDELVDNQRIDSNIRAAAKTVLLNSEVYGSPFGVPPLEEVVNLLVSKIKKNG